MMPFGKYLERGLILCFISCIIFLTGFMKLLADDIDWIEVANVNNEIQFIDSKSIKYNNQGLLSVITKYAETNPEDQQLINSNAYLLAIDCENRLFSKLPVNGDPKQVKNWIKPIDDKLIKTTIINSCSY
tara:strand:- start:6 stop:395 length:390 start_codon:yes stop_codon:yes gene_type:complete